ncbi:hypothetical protein IJS77_02870 [bacterium]|nr:hypothetical protein [bacterium]
MSEENIEKKYSEFISTVSHELRTPLTSIMGFADTLLAADDKLSEEQKKKFLGIIKEQSKRLINMVENLLVVSKLQNSDEKLVFKSVCVNETIKKILNLVKIQFKSHYFILDLNYNLPEILIDTDKFQQIMLNLIENAVKYSPQETNIMIKTEFDDKNVFVKIFDEGIGISDENKQKIFEKFSRLDTPLTRKTQGSGLGLYIVKQTVEKMDGNITVCDNKPKGSCFVLTFKQAQYQSQSEKKLRG